jgi:hypothetical protein
MKREEILQVLHAFIDPKDKAYPGHHNSWSGAPVEAVREVVDKKGFKWNEEQIKVVGTKLAHISSYLTLEWLENINKSEEMIQDAIRSVRPAYLSTLVMHNVTFYVGVALILLAVHASFEGRDLFSAIMGGVGLGTIIFHFFRQPISGVQRSISSLIQLEIIYNSYTKQIGYWKAFEHSDDVDIKENVDNKSKVIKEIEECTQRTVDLIQKYCERNVPPSLGGEDKEEDPIEEKIKRMLATSPKT